MKIFYKNKCFNLISATKPDFCKGCCFACWNLCQAPPILTIVCVVTNRIFKQETKKDIFYES